MASSAPGGPAAPTFGPPAAHLPASTHVKLRNGLDVYLVEDHRAPLAATTVTYAVGNRDDPSPAQNTSELIARLIGEGRTRHFPTTERSAALASMGVASWSAKAASHDDRTVVSSVVPSRALELALYSEAERMAFFSDGVDRAAAVTQGGFRGLEIDGENAKGERWLCRTYIVGDGLMVGSAAGPRAGFDEAVASRFVRSLTFDVGWRVYASEAGRFTVSVPATAYEIAAKPSAKMGESVGPRLLRRRHGGDRVHRGDEPGRPAAERSRGARRRAGADGAASHGRQSRADGLAHRRRRRARPRSLRHDGDWQRAALASADRRRAGLPAGHHREVARHAAR